MRTRDIARHSSGGGAACTALDGNVTRVAEVGRCGETACHGGRPCHFSDWADWGDCSASCDGLRVRTRAVKSGDCSGPLDEAEPCGDTNCPETACEWGPWEDWACDVTGPPSEKCRAACSAECNGVEKVSRSPGPWSKVDPCVGPVSRQRACLVQDEACNADLARDCVFEDWGAWGECNGDCGGQQRDRAREIAVPGQGLGAPCIGTVREAEACVTPHCEGSMDCEWPEWTSWSDCDVQCGGGQRKRTRVPHAPTPRGRSCLAGTVVETEPCGTGPCENLVCGWASWSTWSECDEECGVGQQNRSRNLTLNQGTTQLFAVGPAPGGLLPSRAGALAFFVGLAGMLALQRPRSGYAPLQS